MPAVDCQPPVYSQVEAAIGRRCGWDVRDLQVEVRHGFIILRGRATTFYAKQLAQHSAMAATGLGVLANLIHVG
jgi:BON domain